MRFSELKIRAYKPKLYSRLLFSLIYLCNLIHRLPIVLASVSSSMK